MSHPAWAVAAAILLIEDRELHYKELAQRVVTSGLSNLGIDGSDPSQTLGAEIRRKKDIFSHKLYGNGTYKLNDKKYIHMEDISPVMEYYLSRYMNEYQLLVKETFRKNIEYGYVPFENDFVSAHKRIIQLEKIFHKFSGIS